MRFAPGAGSQIGQDEEPAAAMNRTRRFQNQARLASLRIKLVVSAIRIGLEDTGISVQMALGVLAGAVAGVIEHRRRRCRATERAVIADIGAHSGEGDQPFRLKVITDSGDRDHADHGRQSPA